MKIFAAICMSLMPASILCRFVCLAAEDKGHSRARPVSGDLSAVDLEHLDDALDACDFILDNLTPEGTYRVPEAWGPETDLYLHGSSSALVEAYRITGDRKYLEGARKVFDYMQRGQLPSGGWRLNLSEGGLEFRITEKQRRESWERESLPMIGGFTFAVGKYRQETGDEQYDGMINRAIDHALKRWNPKEGLFIEDDEKQFTSLRSSPISYQALFLLGFQIWQEWRPDLRPIVKRLTEAIRLNYESFDHSTMPFVYVLHAALLMNSSPPEYVTGEIKPRIDSLVHSRVFKCSAIAGGYGHRDGVRGIVNTEANCRGSGAVALVMKLYDLTTGTRTYRDSKEYGEVARWIDSMKDENGYFGYQTERDMRRLGKGSPAQFIPCWWIFGTL